VSDQDTAVQISLFGHFCVKDFRGIDITPRAAKAQGLVALLASCGDGTRSRAWIQSKLWSDRAPNQAAGSLRQCLVQIRQAFGQNSDIINATRQNISLNLPLVTVSSNNGREFLEGFDAGDEAFEDWVLLERQARTNFVMDPEPEKTRTAGTVIAPVAKRSISIAVLADNDDSNEINWLLSQIGDNIALQLKETFSIAVHFSDNDDATRNDEWRIELSAQILDKPALGVRAVLTSGRARQYLWSRSKQMDLRGAACADHPQLRALANELTEAVGDFLYYSGNGDLQCPDQITRTAIRTLFSMKPNDVALADKLFQSAFDLDPRGLYLAWRAQTKTIQIAERHVKNDKALIEESEYLCNKALELEPNNSMVLATVANTLCHLLKTADRGLHLAERSVLLNPTNPMAWWAQSSAKVYAGDVDQALKDAIMASRLVVTSPHRFWWDNQLFGAALVRDNLEDAQFLAERSHKENPYFRPPIRYLIAFYANQGRSPDALKMATKLKALESDFSVSRLIEDKTYPASLLHRTKGINLDRLSEIA
jgi:DNA-binding SARP family transcriptional activator